MKICINGDLLDLSKLYRVSSINEHHIYSTPFHRRKESIEKYQHHIILLFTLYFINNKKYTIQISREFISDYANYSDSLEFKDYLNEITSFRDSVIKKWDKGSFQYPQLNIDSIKISPELEGYESSKYNKDDGEYN